MKRTIGFALMISLLLVGCGRGAGDEEAFQNWRESCRSGEITFSADILAQTTDTAYRCSADCRSTAEETGVTLTQPELIAGVSYRVRSGESALEYDGASLLLGAPEAEVTPATAAPLLMEAIREGHLTRLWREGECLAAELKVEEGLAVTLWLENGVPCRAEIVRDGYTAAVIEMDQWQQKEA